MFLSSFCFSVVLGALILQLSRKQWWKLPGGVALRTLLSYCAGFSAIVIPGIGLEYAGPTILVFCFIIYVSLTDNEVAIRV